MAYTMLWPLMAEVNSNDCLFIIEYVRQQKNFFIFLIYFFIFFNKASWVWLKILATCTQILKEVDAGSDRNLLK